jgi:hypothetical protein
MCRSDITGEYAVTTAPPSTSTTNPAMPSWICLRRRVRAVKRRASSRSILRRAATARRSSRQLANLEAGAAGESAFGRSDGRVSCGRAGPSRRSLVLRPTGRAIGSRGSDSRG